MKRKMRPILLSKGILLAVCIYGSIVLSLSSCASLKKYIPGLKAKDKAEEQQLNEDTLIKRVVIGDKMDEEQFRKWIVQSLPATTEPVIERKYIPDHIQGNQYVQGHFIYILKSQSKWQSQ